MQKQSNRERVSVSCIKYIDYSNSASSTHCLFIMSVLAESFVVNLHVSSCTYIYIYISYVSVLGRTGDFIAVNMSACVQQWVFVCCQPPTVSSAWMSKRAINTWGSRNTQTPSLDCIYGYDWGGGGRGGGGVVMHSLALAVARVQPKHRGC